MTLRLLLVLTVLAFVPALAQGESTEPTPPADAGLEDRGIVTFEIPWYSIDGGGTVSSGGEFVLTGTLGQPDAGNSTNGGFELAGGFWAVNRTFPDVIFADGFETGNTSRWSDADPSPSASLNTIIAWNEGD